MPTATLRLLAVRGRVLTSRRGVVGAAARARGGGSTYTLWPDARQPMIAADMGYPPAAEWLRRTMVPTLRRLPDAAGWMALRARAALIPEREGLAANVGTRLLGTAVPLRVAMFSPSGQPISKVLCFLFREGDDRPHLVVKAIAEPELSWRLATESELLESIRSRVAGDPRVAEALPPPPLLAGREAGEFMLAERYDALATATGDVTRGRAMAWLHGFQSASCTGVVPWTLEDERGTLDGVRDSWQLARLDAESAVQALERLLVALRGVGLPRCAVHGDFWRGNVAARDGDLRVYDWEWSVLDGTPLIDLWTYHLAELRVAANRGLQTLDEPLRLALDHVRAELRNRGVDERFALAMLPSVLGGLAFRVRRRLRTYDGMEAPSIGLMAACHRLLEAG